MKVVNSINSGGYQSPRVKWLELNSESELLNATLGGQTILDDDPTAGSDDPWNEGLGKKNVWDDEEE